jgi:16S rRNA (uracil1498-N3)-methyltransferase
MADRFYINCPLDVGPVVLQGPEAHHLAAVRRVRPGDRVFLFNGDGREYTALVQALARRSVTLQVVAVETPERETGFRLEVAAPLPKGDRAQFLVEKLTELGATRFVPLQTARSVIQPREARLEKLIRYAIEASKQCGRNTLLQIESPADWAAYCCRGDLPQAKILAHSGGQKGAWRTGQDVALAVGPEGGMTEVEIEQAQEAGWRLVSLGSRTLRIETAALVLAVQSLP